MKIKILYFIGGMGAGGKERQLAALLKKLSSDGEFEIALAVLNKEVFFQEIFDLDIQVHYLERKSRRDLSVLAALMKLCKQFRPDILHTWDSITSLYALPVVKLLGIKFINGLLRHAARPRLFNKLWLMSKLTFPLSHRVVSNSMAALEAHGLKPSKKNVCIYNGFDGTRLKGLIPGEEIRSRFALSTPRLVGMVANFEDRKDYQSFLKASELIVKQRKGVTFMAVGNGKNYQQCKSLIKTQHRDRIKLVGRQRDVESIVNLFDIGLLINNTNGHAEGISNSIMEYMALGKPVIATDSGGNPELVLHNETGFIIKPFDVGELIAKIEFLLDHEEKAAQMGRRAKERIEAHFSLDRMSQQYSELYREVKE